MVVQWESAIPSAEVVIVGGGGAGGRYQTVDRVAQVEWFITPVWFASPAPYTVTLGAIFT